MALLGLLFLPIIMKRSFFSAILSRVASNDASGSRMTHIRLRAICAQVVGAGRSRDEARRPIVLRHEDFTLGVIGMPQQ